MWEKRIEWKGVVSVGRARRVLNSRQCPAPCSPHSSILSVPYILPTQHQDHPELPCLQFQGWPYRLRISAGRDPCMESCPKLPSNRGSPRLHSVPSSMRTQHEDAAASSEAATLSDDSVNRRVTEPSQRKRKAFTTANRVGDLQLGKDLLSL